MQAVEALIESYQKCANFVHEGYQSFESGASLGADYYDRQFFEMDNNINTLAIRRDLLQLQRILEAIENRFTDSFLAQLEERIENSRKTYDDDASEYWNLKGISNLGRILNGKFLLKEDFKLAPYVAKFCSIIDQIGPNSVLEAGTGYGRVLRSVKRLNPSLSKLRGADISPSQIYTAILLDDILFNDDVERTYLNAPNWDLPFEDSEFDLVYSYGSLMELREKDIEPALAEMFRASSKHVVLSECCSAAYAETNPNVTAHDYQTIASRLGYAPIHNFDDDFERPELGYQIILFDVTEHVKPVAVGNLAETDLTQDDQLSAIELKHHAKDEAIANIDKDYDSNENRLTNLIESICRNGDNIDAHEELVNCLQGGERPYQSKTLSRRKDFIIGRNGQRPATSNSVISIDQPAQYVAIDPSKITDRHFDAVVIGTSPAMLIEAAYLKSQGASVLNIEEQPVLGGNWATENLSFAQEVDYGPHILHPFTGAYDFLINRIGIELEDITDKAFNIMKYPILGRHRVPLVHWWTQKNTDEGLSKQLEAEVNSIMSEGAAFDDFESINDGMQHHYADGYLANRDSRLSYFVGGCRQFLRAMETFAMKNELNILHKTVENLELSEQQNGVRVHLGDMSLWAAEVVCPTQGFINYITGPEIDPIKVSTLMCTKQLMLAVDNNQINDYIYIRYQTDGPITSLQNSTNYRRLFNDARDETSIIGLQIRSEMECNAQIVSEAIVQMKNDGLLDSEASVKDYRWRSAIRYRNNPGEINQVSQLPGGACIRFFKTNDLALSIQENLERWKNVKFPMAEKFEIGVA